MKKTTLLIILGAAVIGLSMNAYAMMGGGGTHSSQAGHGYDDSQRYHAGQEYHSSGSEQYRTGHEDHMDGDGSNGQAHFMDDDFFDHDETHQIDHGGNGDDAHDVQDMHGDDPYVH